MSGPDISPLLARIGGEDFRETLKARLLQLADETDDPAYARRLREVADGTRPLRTLAMDPAWNRQFGDTAPSVQQPPDLDPEQREVLARRVEELRRHVQIPTDPEEIAQIARDVLDRTERARQAIRNDELAGWDHVHTDSPGKD